MFIQFVNPEKRVALKQRRTAVSALFSSQESGLKKVKRLVEEPWLHGSLANLVHYLSKDPGRMQFRGLADRRRAEKYLSPIVSEVEWYKQEYANLGMEWQRLFLSTTRVLFEILKTDINRITEKSSLLGSQTDIESANEALKQAIRNFSENWIPLGYTSASYQTDKSMVREYLVKSARFDKGMKDIDNAWRTLLAHLYNLMLNPSWDIAVSLDPSLQQELDELTIFTLSYDINRRGLDFMATVLDSNRLLGQSESSGIRWVPNLFFYKNIEEINGHVKDDSPTVFFIKVNLGYTFQDVRTQTWLNDRKDWLTDYFKTFFSNHTYGDFSHLSAKKEIQQDWEFAKLKAEAIHPLNKKLVHEHSFGSSKVFGIREMAIVRFNIIRY